MPGLETSAVFQVSNDHLINRLYDWVENAEEPLKSYATGLLGAAMDIQEIAIAYREQNIRILPVLLQRLKQTQISEDNQVMAKDSNESLDTQDSTEGARNTIPLYPLTLATRQMLILHYLTPMGEYQVDFFF
jgi:HIV-1 Vpr-binding protein